MSEPPRLAIIGLGYVGLPVLEQASGLQLPVIAQIYGFARWALLAPALSGLKDRLLGRAPGAVKPAVQPGKPLLLLSLTHCLLQEPKARVCIDKARQRLGYQPRCDLAKGMQLTERWAEWANLL